MNEQPAKRLPRPEKSTDGGAPTARETKALARQLAREREKQRREGMREELHKHGVDTKGMTELQMQKRLRKIAERAQRPPREGSSVNAFGWGTGDDPGATAGAVNARTRGAAKKAPESSLGHRSAGTPIRYDDDT